MFDELFLLLFGFCFLFFRSSFLLCVGYLKLVIIIHCQLTNLRAWCNKLTIGYKNLVEIEKAVIIINSFKRPGHWDHSKSSKIKVCIASEQQDQEWKLQQKRIFVTNRHIDEIWYKWELCQIVKINVWYQYHQFMCKDRPYWGSYNRFFLWLNGIYIYKMGSNYTCHNFTRVTYYF